MHLESDNELMGENSGEQRRGQRRLRRADEQNEEIEQSLDFQEPEEDDEFTSEGSQEPSDADEMEEEEFNESDMHLLQNQESQQAPMSRIEQRQLMNIYSAANPST